MVDLLVWEHFLRPSRWPFGQGHWATDAGHNLPCPHNIVRTAHPITTQFGTYIPLIMIAIWFNFGEILAKNVFMPPPLGAGGIMFSGCPSVRPSVCPSVRPSVRSLKYPLLTCTWVRWSTRPTVTILRHVRPSVRPSVRLSVRPSGEVSGHLPENAWREWPEILHADVSWPSSELISLWQRSVDFSNFGAILT